MELSAFAKTNTAARLRAAASRGALSHALILSGAGDRNAAAHYAAAALECTGTDKPCLACAHCRKVLADIHPDVLTVRDDEHAELSVDVIRGVRTDAFIRPNEGACKVYIFPDCTRLNEKDQNVLLKTVEEGPPYAAFVFCTDSPSALLETVRSRCVLLKYDAVSEDALPPEAEQLCRAFARGKVLPVTTYLVALENRRMKREELRDVLRSAWCAAAEALLLQMGGKQTPDPACGETAQALARGLTARQLRQLTALLEKYSGECEYNVGAGHVLGALAVEWEELL